MSGSIGLVGSGRLHTALVTMFGGRAIVMTVPPRYEAGLAQDQAPEQVPALLVVATDGWDTEHYKAVRATARGLGIPWLPVRGELGRVVIGPWEFVGKRGCATCVESRRSCASGYGEAFAVVRQRHAKRLAARPAPWLTELATDMVAHVVMDEVNQPRDRPGTEESSPGTRALLEIDLGTLAVSRRTFIPDPLCPDCGGLPKDTPEAARLVLTSQPKPDRDTYRVRPAPDPEELFETYVDPRLGVIQDVTTWADGGLVVSHARWGARGGGVTGGTGRTRSRQSSELTAIFEALERFGTAEPGGRGTTVLASRVELGQDAVDPCTFGLYPEERYALPGFGYQPYRDTEARAWVWGYSFARRQPVLIPESYAYMGRSLLLEEESDPSRFVYETANGGALGGCLEEAILYGLLEIAERDAFLLTWYTRLPASRVDLNTAQDGTIPLLAEAIRGETGFDIQVFDTTLEQGIPSVWAMAVNPVDHPTAAKTLSTAGSHLNPERAVLNALAELGHLTVHMARTRYPANAERAREMAADPTQVRRMFDHRLLYGYVEVFNRFDFLTHNDQLRAFADAFAPDRPRIRHNDLRDDLLDALQRYLDTGLDVLVVDQTTDEHRAAGLHCAKVIVPGTIPLAFGYQYRRVDDLPRLHHVPELLGYRDRPLRPDEINPHPHPFP